MPNHKIIGKIFTILALGGASSLLLTACADPSQKPAAAQPPAGQSPAGQGAAELPKFAINVQAANSKNVGLQDIAQSMNNFLKTHNTIRPADLPNITVREKDPVTGEPTGALHHLNEFVTIK